MYRSLVFTLLLLAGNSARSFACVYWPEDEETRFSIFDPVLFGLKGYDPFYYTSNSFASSGDDSSYTAGKWKITLSEKLNIDSWRARYKNAPAAESVYEAIYGRQNEFSDPHAMNAFVRFLYQRKDTEAISYLSFARGAGYLVEFLSDPWERNEDVLEPQRRHQIDEAVGKARSAVDPEIRERYAFLAIRTAYYNKQRERIKTVYAEFFESRNEKNIVDYWAMYFRMMSEPESAYKNFLAAQVFANAPDKRFVTIQNYSRDVPVTGALALAKTKHELAAIWMLDAFKRPGRALEDLKQLSSLGVYSEALDFLVLREINKLEDWIYTPYYFDFSPSVLYADQWEVFESKPKTWRVTSDRLYAQQLLDFLNAHLEEKQHNRLVWEASRDYLLFMTNADSPAIREIDDFKSRYPAQKEIVKTMERIRALSLVKTDPLATRSIPKNVEATLLEESKLEHGRFIFAMAKEFQYRGNTSDAALLFSKINENVNFDEYDLSDATVYWADERKNAFWYNDYYEEYFSYIDIAYTTAQIRELVQNVETNLGLRDSFSSWKYGVVKKDLPRLYDLLGTKYMRDNNLDAALASFEKVNDTLWSSSYYPYQHYLNANPFYANMYNEHLMLPQDSIRYTKPQLVRTLIGYLKKANDTTNANRDYFYFLAANCYLNMTTHGNAWMMKRYGWSSEDYTDGFSDAKDYYNCELAKQYYLKAKSVAKRKKFAALCLRMAGRCEKYRLRNIEERKTYAVNDEKIFNDNMYYRQLKTQYPSYYDDLISNCYSFDEYFKARR